MTTTARTTELAAIFPGLREPVEFTSRAWWLSAGISTDRGVTVARIEARGTVLRKPSEQQLRDDPTLNRYWVDASNEGDHQTYMISLTTADLDTYGLAPGVLLWPEVVDGGCCPTTIVSQSAAQRAQDYVNNEGWHNPEWAGAVDNDNTPWQKGDEAAE